jgi:adenine deaminase
VVDVQDGEVLCNHDVWIMDGRIVKIHKSCEDRSQKLEWRIFDLPPDSYIVPGLIDCHAYTANFCASRTDVTKLCGGKGIANTE